jgi:hypothetical protein
VNEYDEIGDEATDVLAERMLGVVEGGDGDADAYGESAALDDEMAHFVPQFEGDRSELTLAQRKALVTVLKHTYVSMESHPQVYATILESEDVIASRLNDLFLDLHLDRNYKIAFKRKAVPPNPDRPFPTLVYDTPYNREETILMVFLRERFRSERSAGADDVFIDVEDMLERVVNFRPEHATDVSGDERKVRNAIEALRKAGVLVKTGDENRMRISPVIEVVLPLPALRAMLSWLVTENQDDQSSETDARDEFADGDGVRSDEVLA